MEHLSEKNEFIIRIPQGWNDDRLIRTLVRRATVLREATEKWKREYGTEARDRKERAEQQMDDLLFRVLRVSEEVPGNPKVKIIYDEE